MISNSRRYGAAIALVSGLYSLWSASMATRMGTGGWLMAVLGVVVIVHGAALLTAFADRIGDASGPLMIGYAVLMLFNQALFGGGMGMTDGGMNGGMGMDGGMAGSARVGMGMDAGMIALATLMLLSGIIMARDGGTDGM
ncbi:MAG: hypothetical protein ACOCQU_03845 [Halolamina sp.]